MFCFIFGSAQYFHFGATFSASADSVSTISFQAPCLAVFRILFSASLASFQRPVGAYFSLEQAACSAVGCFRRNRLGIGTISSFGIFYRLFRPDIFGMTPDSAIFGCFRLALG
jgi:hypothetical protein